VYRRTFSYVMACTIAAIAPAKADPIATSTGQSAGVGFRIGATHRTRARY
jgi:hypothetical protein